EVFNRELGEGLSSAWETGRDEDRFDAGCDHLLVEEVASRKPVGTYRLQTAAMAARHQGFYSDDEFDLDGLPAEVRDNAVELGRACVAREHRNGRRSSASTCATAPSSAASRPSTASSAPSTSSSSSTSPRWTRGDTAPSS